LGADDVVVSVQRSVDGGSGSGAMGKRQGSISIFGSFRRENLIK